MKSSTILTVFISFLLAGGTAVAQTATYSVTFETTWTAENHPVDYPEDPHFSGWSNANHNGLVSFWNVGELASEGIKVIAETGNRLPLNQEYNAAIAAGTAEARHPADPLWEVPGTLEFQMSVSIDYPLVTLVSMIAPSPDWFVGVSGLDLRAGEGWVSSLEMDLYPYDAGTDSGPSYSQPNNETVPPDPITIITNGPFTPGVPLGSLTFTLLGVSGVPETALLAAHAFPNPFNPRTTIAWVSPSAGDLAIDLYDVRGRLVRRLMRNKVPAGPGEAIWDGRDAVGRPVQAGVYFARIATGQGTEVVKMTLVE